MKRKNKFSQMSNEELITYIATYYSGWTVIKFKEEGEGFNVVRQRKLTNELVRLGILTRQRAPHRQMMPRWTPQEVDKSFYTLTKAMGRVPVYNEFQEKYPRAVTFIHLREYDSNIDSYDQYLASRGYDPKAVRLEAEQSKKKPKSLRFLENLLEERE